MHADFVESVVNTAELGVDCVFVLDPHVGVAMRTNVSIKFLLELAFLVVQGRVGTHDAMIFQSTRRNKQTRSVSSRDEARRIGIDGWM